jgi:SH3-like domain-containing protein
MEHCNASARVRLEYKVQYQNPIQVMAGESVQVGRADEDDPGWLWCRAADGREGWMPVELLSRQASRAIVLRDYSARELAVEPGDEVELEEVRHGWALVRNTRGELGWIPKSHIEPDG